MVRSVLVVLLVAAGLEGCVSLNRYGALREAYERAEEEQKGAKKELASLKAAHEALAGRTKELEDGLRQARLEKDTLKAALGSKEDEHAATTRQLQAAAGARAAEDAERDRVARALETALREELGEGLSTVRRRAQAVSVELAEQVLYAGAATATIKPGGLKVLKRIADVLKLDDSKDLRVESHVNKPARAPRGRHPSGWELSSARAAGVARYLAEYGRVHSSRVTAVGYGRGQSRRDSDPSLVEIIVGPAAGPR